MIIGVFMFYGFMSLAFTIHFFLKVASRFDDEWISALGLAFLSFWHFWLPAVLLILLTYLLLTRVYKYDT